MKTSKLIYCSFPFIAFTCLWVDPIYAVNDVADSPLYGATMTESLSDLIAPQTPNLANDDEMQPEILRSAVIAPTKCPIQQKMTTCTEATTCVIEQTRCGNYTHCVTENDTERYCPAPTKWPSNLAAATRCPNKKEATVCPFNETKCPEKDTICPNIADKVPTMCPESRTRCPEETTVCQKVNVSTECPEKETRCPVRNDTRCPDAKHKLPTVCPVVTTKCPI